MEYIIDIQTDFGELTVCFETDGILESENEVFEIALEKMGESRDIQLTGLLEKGTFYEVIEGRTLEDQ